MVNRNPSNEIKKISNPHLKKHKQHQSKHQEDDFHKTEFNMTNV